MTIGIYKAILKNDATKSYIGQSWNIEKRWIMHENDSKHKTEKHPWAFYRALRKYGFDAFIWEIILELPDDITQADLDCYEIFYIRFFRTRIFEGGYNMSGGGSGGRHAPETRLLISLHGRGKKRSDTARNNISKGKTGKKKRSMSTEGRENMRISVTGRKHTEEAKRNMSMAQTGHPVSDETKDLQSQRATGRKHTEEEKKHMSEIRTGITPSADTIVKFIDTRRDNRIETRKKATEIEKANNSSGFK